MVGLLVVSHSPQIASGVKELADQMTGGRVPIVAVGGTVDGRIGISPDGIRAGFDQLAGPDGVLILSDLGSATMSAEAVLEDVDVPLWLSSAPLVEGAVLAAVEASLGSTLQQTAAAAERAWELQKTGSKLPGDTPAERPMPKTTAEVVLAVDHPSGLHLRPAARFVKSAAAFTSKVRLQNLSRPDAPEVDAKSMFGVMRSGVLQGHRIRLSAEGPDAEAALSALQALVAKNFNEL
jgi:phosphocarrier protein FPr